LVGEDEEGNIWVLKGGSMVKRGKGSRGGVKKKKEKHTKRKEVFWGGGVEGVAVLGKILERLITVKGPKEGRTELRESKDRTPKKP